MIEQKGLAVFNKAVAETITRAVCTISGKDYTLPIKSVTVEGAKFKVNIYLDDTLSWYRNKHEAVRQRRKLTYPAPGRRTKTRRKKSSGSIPT